MRANAPLTWRQQQLYTGRIVFYSRSEVSVMDDQGVKDGHYGPLPTWTDVPCYRRDSQEDNVPTAVGRGQGDQLLTLTEFYIAFDQPCEDGWLAVFTQPKGVGGGDDTRNYVVQGAPKYTPASGGRNVSRGTFFALECGPIETIQSCILSTRLVGGDDG